MTAIIDDARMYGNSDNYVVDFKGLMGLMTFDGSFDLGQVNDEEQKSRIIIGELSMM